MYPQCYIAEGCEGDEACQRLCPRDRNANPETHVSEEVER